MDITTIENQMQEYLKFNSEFDEINRGYIKNMLNNSDTNFKNSPDDDKKYYEYKNKLVNYQNELKNSILNFIKTNDFKIINRNSSPDLYDENYNKYVVETNIGNLNTEIPNKFSDINNISIYIDIPIPDEDGGNYIPLLLNMDIQYKKDILYNIFKLKILEREVVEYKIDYINKSDYEFGNVKYFS